MAAGLPSGSLDVPSGSVDMPSGSVDVPSGSVDMPSGSADIPSVDLSGKGPHMPSVGGDIAGELPSASLDASGSLPSGEVDVSVPSVSGAVDMPSVDVKKPKKSMFGSIFGSGKGKMEVTAVRLTYIRVFFRVVCVFAGVYRTCFFLPSLGLFFILVFLVCSVLSPQRSAPKMCSCCDEVF